MKSPKLPSMASTFIRTARRMNRHFVNFFSLLVSYLELILDIYLRNCLLLVDNMESCCGCSAWFQRELLLKPRRRGCHLITDEIEKIQEVKNIKIGLCHVLSE